jgi:glutamine synthetase
MADRHILFKLLVRETVRRSGRRATFMAKPFAHLPGSSSHIHVSYSCSAAGFSAPSTIQETARTLAGEAPELMLAYAPTRNSYRRFAGGDFAPQDNSVDVESRLAAVRLIDGPSPHLENRIPGADSNPYLTIAATLHAILPDRPTSSAVSSLLPSDLPIAIEAARTGGTFAATFSPTGRDYAILLAEAEHRADLNGSVSDWEWARYSGSI